LVQALAAGDKVDANDNQFSGTFPYVALPNVGAVNKGGGSAGAAADSGSAGAPAAPGGAMPSSQPAVAGAGDTGDLTNVAAITTGGVGVFAVLAALGFFLWFRRRRPRTVLVSPQSAPPADPND
jgi:hypothetical protein